MEVDEKYMKRALELAAHGQGNTSPNPMVGAVIVAPDGSIIGEGYHRQCGKGHAEVNAVASVKDKSGLKDSTMYVTLEPCSHYGKTPPCARLIIDSGIPRVVVGATDPFPEVSGRGIRMLREAGVEVVEGVLAEESRQLNRKFMTAHTHQRPFVTLKWAQSADGFMDSDRPSGTPHKFSTRLGTTLVHHLRSLHDAILVGSGTALADNPQLNCRLWPGRSPRPVVVDRAHKVEPDKLRMEDPLILDAPDIPMLLKELYSKGITSLLVEGGAALLSSFIESGLWDEARVEISAEPLKVHGRVPAPVIPAIPRTVFNIGENRIVIYDNNGTDCHRPNAD